MRIINEQPNDVPLTDMKDGQIAVITAWTCNHESTLVQRYKNDLIALGHCAGDCWPNIFGELEGRKKEANKLRVRILRPGTQIEI